MEHFFKPYVCLGHSLTILLKIIIIVLALTKFVICKNWKSFCVIMKEVSKYCSKLSMQTENWILRLFSSFAMSK